MAQLREYKDLSREEKDRLAIALNAGGSRFLFLVACELSLIAANQYIDGMHRLLDAMEVKAPLQD